MNEKEGALILKYTWILHLLQIYLISKMDPAPII